jgi:hypothetical protein
MFLYFVLGIMIVCDYTTATENSGLQLLQKRHFPRRFHFGDHLDVIVLSTE